MAKSKLFDALKNTHQILEGIKNNVFKKEHVELIANERWKICKNCDHLDTEGSHCLMPGSQPCCSDCGCSLAFKIRSLSAGCPKEKWEALLTEEEETKFLK